MEIVTTASNEQLLRTKCEEIELRKENMEEFTKLINDMANLMVASNGCGIAAPQVGKNIAMFIAVLDGKAYLFINPEIVSKSAEMEEDEEGCLSIPGYCGIVKRHAAVTLNFINWGKWVNEGVVEMQEARFTGRDARIIQHEYDHLEGRLYIDKARDVHRREESA